MEWPNGTNRVCPRCFPLFRWRTPKIWIAQAAVTWSRQIFRNLSEAGLSNPWTSGKLRFTAVYLSNITHISAWRVHGTKHAVILLLSLLSGTGFVNVDEIQTYFISKPFETIFDLIWFSDSALKRYPRKSWIPFVLFHRFPCRWRLPVAFSEVLVMRLRMVVCSSSMVPLRYHKVHSNLRPGCYSSTHCFIRCFYHFVYFNISDL